MKKGDVYFVDLNPVVGSEQGGIRPAVIIQNDIGNEHSPTIIVALITTQMKSKLPTHVMVCEKDKLSQASVIMMEQIRTIDKHRIKKFVCGLCGETMEKVDKALGISLAIDNKKEKEGDDSMNDLQVFNNEEMGMKVRTILNDDGSIAVNAEDTAIGFGWIKTEEKNGKQYTSIRWERMNNFSAECGFAHLWAKDDYIPEGLFYRLGMKANNPVAERFQNWLAMEVIPSIRKNGGYQYKKMTPEEMMRIQLGMLDEHKEMISKNEERISVGEERITKLEETMNIDYGQQRVLEKEVAKVVMATTGGNQAPAYKELGRKVFAECNNDVKEYFHVNSRNNIPRVRFDDAVEYIKGWQPCTNTKVAIKVLNEGRKAG